MNKIKPVLFLLVLLLFSLTVYSTSLADYPRLFDNGVTIMVGDQGEAEDVIAASDIAIALQAEGVTTVGTKLASEVDNPKYKNLIIVGNACKNEFVKLFVSANCVDNKDSRYSDNEYGIVLVKNNGKYQLLVGGQRPANTRMGGLMLASKDNLAGREMKGTGNSWHVVDSSSFSGDQTGSASSQDLSSFPDNFFEGNRFDGYIVSGKKGSAVDVIGQTAIATAVNAYANVPQRGITKLDDEVSIQNNLILIGNPCVNDLTAELMGSPSPCDADFPSGKGYIRYYEKNGYKYVVVAGKDDLSNKKAAEYLADFAHKNLDGTEIEIVTGPAEPEKNEVDDLLAKIEKNKELEKQQEEQRRLEEERLRQEQQQNQNNDSNDEQQNIIVEDNHSNEEVNDEVAANDTAIQNQTSTEPQLEQDKGVFLKLFSWLRGLFN